MREKKLIVKPYNEFAIHSPRMILYRNQEAVIEGCKKILIYTDNMIRFQTKKQEICFYGSGLSLKSLNSENIIITGMIDKIEYFA